MPYYKEGNLGRTWLSPTQAVYRDTAADEPVKEVVKTNNVTLWFKSNWIYVVVAIIIVILFFWYSSYAKNNRMRYRSNY